DFFYHFVSLFMCYKVVQFLKRLKTKPYSNKRLYLGITFLFVGLIFNIYKSHLGLSAYFNGLIIWSLLAFGLTYILSRLFFTASPITEIVINRNSVEILRMANLIREFNVIKDFKINQESIILESERKIFELVDLDLSEEQQVQLKNEFTTLKNHLNESSQRQKRALRRIRKFLCLKRF
ncbi:hypothetical protein, partial [Carboxylicivirga marina]|uniref:hypothetical protein n=1 Tax=Carboxylicivirga marina TaxID=2800988 RepID=UPI001F3625F0